MAVAVLLQGCGGTRGRGQLKYDSATNACRHQPASCAQAAGQEAVLPTAVRTFATAGGSAVAAVKLLDDALRQEVTEALEECANHARTQVILERFGNRSPTPEECREELDDVQGRTVTLAMKLGEEMHRVALRCAAEKLNALRPGGFSIEPTYQYDQGRKKKTWLSAADVDRIRQEGSLGELKGSLVPDVVLHAGHPDQVQAVYDFKFPCVDITIRPRWRDYPSGHPYAGKNQRDMYVEAFRVEVVIQVVPWLGAGL
ncbi:hypothetical protein D7X12_36175 [Corallococcus sicarius]|uniref:Uncharacterized protein n=1 Tax=Corallococcus sicarius TaxID=2316726 RepID=A0A3A8N2A6_9BACT|nr:hypothetical protein D7X12_36175 [Corallococcus sicarius]